MHAKHKSANPRRRQRPVLVAVTLAVVAGLSLAPAPAVANHEPPVLFDQLVLKLNDSRSAGQCVFEVQSFDNQTSEVTGRLAASAWPTTLLGNVNNKYVQIDCVVFGQPPNGPFSNTSS